MRRTAAPRLSHRIGLAIGVALLIGVAVGAARAAEAPEDAGGGTVIAVGNAHACALPGDGTIVCWGSNSFGQLGDGTVDDSDVPVAVLAEAGSPEPLRGAVAIAAGFSHSCAGLEDGTVRCWGDNAIIDEPTMELTSLGGQLGDGTKASSLTPVTVLPPTGVEGPLTGVNAVTAGLFRTCALGAEGTVTCWGGGETRPVPVGQSGPGSEPLREAVALTSGDRHTCVLLADTTASCWGENASGELGNGEVGFSIEPVVVTAGDGPLSGVTAVAAGGGFFEIASAHSCALLEDSTVRCWGNNDQGQVGDGSADVFFGDPVLVPTTVVAGEGDPSPLTGVTAIAAGPGNSCALVPDGGVACWGGNLTAPFQVRDTDANGFLLGATAVAVGAQSACAVLGDGSVACWIGDVIPNVVPGLRVGVSPSGEPTPEPQESEEPQATPAPAPGTTLQPQPSVAASPEASDAAVAPPPDPGQPLAGGGAIPMESILAVALVAILLGASWFGASKVVQRSATPGAHTQERVLVLVMGTLLLSPLLFGALVAAIPAPAPGPDARLIGASTGLPMPAPGASPLPAGLPEDLPLIVDIDTGGATDRPIAIDAPMDAAALFEESWHSLTGDDPSQVGFTGWSIVQGPGVGGEFVDEAFLADLDATILATSSDPLNARRLANAAVGLFLVGVTVGVDGQAPPFDGATYGEREALLAAAVALLSRAAGQFDDRSLAVNHAYLADLIGEDGTPSLERYLANHPDDVGARLLLAGLGAQARAGLAEALDVLAPLRGDPSLVSLADLAEADALIANADANLRSSPHLVGDLARRALDRYDRAIEATGDAAAYAGRAAALDILGETAAAVEAQQASVGLTGGSSAQLLRLAELRSCAGDDRGRLDSARAAWELAATAPTTLREVRLVDYYRLSADPYHRGYLSTSVGSDRSPFTLPVEGLGAAGFISYASEASPPRDPCIVPTASVGDSALDEILEAAIALKDGAAIDSVASEFGLVDEFDVNPAVWTAANVAIGRLAGVEADPTTALAVSGYLQPADAVTLCLQALEASPRAPEAADLRACAARAEAAIALGAEDSAAAERALTDAFDAQVAALIERPQGALVLEAGGIAEARGDDAAAERLYLRASAIPETSAAAFARLAVLAFDRDDLASAQTLLDLAISATERLGGRDAERFRGYLHSNRGVVRLGLARIDPHGPPDCARFADVCHLAEEDIAAALASDPANWVYLLNAAWVARLTGDVAEARSLLEATLAVAPATPPALNDLGVLQALDGETAAARASFHAALSVAPDYDLATWNLGVLESGGTVPWLAGQRYLASGVDRGTALRTATVGYRLDEQVYKVDLTSGQGLELSRGGSAPGAVVAAAVASIAAVSSVATVVGSMQASLQEVLRTGSETVAPGIAKRLRGRLKGFGVGRGLLARAGAAIAWVPLILVLLAATGWSAVAAWPDAPVAGLVFAAFATAIAVWCHLLGHRIAALVLGLRVRPAIWKGGVVASLLAIPLQMPAGPFPGEQFEGVDTRTKEDRDRVWAATVVGPLINIVGATVAFLAYLWIPMPFLRVLTVTHLAVGAFSLIVTRPLDGSRLAQKHPWVAPLMALAIGGFAAVLATGLA